MGSTCSYGLRAVLDDFRAAQPHTADAPAPQGESVPSLDEKDALWRVARSAKEFIDDWRKGDFTLTVLAGYGGRSIDEALTALSIVVAAAAAADSPSGSSQR